MHNEVPGESALSAESKQELSLMKDFLSIALKPGMCSSFLRPSTDDLEDPLAFVQVLALQQQCTTAEECRPLQEDDHLALKLEISIQSLERMVAEPSPDVADVFTFSDELPTTMRSVLVPADRPNILCWQHIGESTYESCLSLRNPKVLQPDGMHLLDKSIPVLSLLDGLSERGWVGALRGTIHSLHADKVFDSRKPLSKRRYFQCLIILDELLAPGTGINAIRSGLPQTFYAYIIRLRKLPPPGQTMKQLQADLKDLQDGECDLGPQLPALPLPVASADAGLDAEAMAEIAWDSPLPRSSPSFGPSGAEVEDPGVEPPPPLAGPESELPEPGPDSDCEIAAPDDDADAAEIVPADGDWPAVLEGIAVKCIAGRRGGKDSRAARLGVLCPCCDFFKKRSTALMTSELGPRAAVYFLGAWLNKYGQPGHREWKPSLSDMQSYRLRHP